MNPLGRLEQLLLAGLIDEEEYKEKKATYIETLLDMYVHDIIDKEELMDKLNL